MITFLFDQHILHRTHTPSEQDLVHYVAKDTLFDYYYFSLVYYLTLHDDGENMKIFPLYKDSVLDGV